MKQQHAVTTLVSAILIVTGASSALAQGNVPSVPNLPQPIMTTYVVGVIRRGPSWGSGTADDAQRIQEGHMANIRKMASTGKLIIAGPFEDRDVRGLFIFGVDSEDDARALLRDDPAVESGRLIVDLYQWFAPAGLSTDQVVRSRKPLAALVRDVQRADYTGDRDGLQRLYGRLAVYESEEVKSRVQYWRGFALWRRAINGFNDQVDSQVLRDDLVQALGQFEASDKTEPGSVEAKIGALSCIGLLSFATNEKDPKRIQSLLERGKVLRNDIERIDRDNPRFLWVIGANYWYIPLEQGGGQDKAMEIYQNGLKSVNQRKTLVNDPLEVSWGEPELLMNLARSNLHRTDPDLNAAEQYARQALRLVPEWHYVRDILLPQIEKAKANTK